jgi:hypothetical protein
MLRFDSGENVPAKLCLSIYRNLATLFSISFPLSEIRPNIRLPLVSMSGCQSLSSSKSPAFTFLSVILFRFSV